MQRLWVCTDAGTGAVLGNCRAQRSSSLCPASWSGFALCEWGFLPGLRCPQPALFGASSATWGSGLLPSKSVCVKRNSTVRRRIFTTDPNS